MLWLCQRSQPQEYANNTLNVFGNANMDDRLDEEDISYLQGIINGRNKPTNLDDANNDGLVDSKDIDQIKKVISGRRIYSMSMPR